MRRLAALDRGIERLAVVAGADDQQWQPRLTLGAAVLPSRAGYPDRGDSPGHPLVIPAVRTGNHAEKERVNPRLRLCYGIRTHWADRKAPCRRQDRLDDDRHVCRT